MFPTTQNQPRGPLSPWVRGDQMNAEMSQCAQSGQESLMRGMNDVERFLEENAATVCVTGLLLGTFVDKRFLLLPLAIGGIKLWRSLQS